MGRSNNNVSKKVEVAAVEAYLGDISDDDLLAFLRTLPMVWSDTERMKVSDFIYEAMLWPYVKHAWSVIRIKGGFPSLLHSVSDVYDLAERQLEIDTGRKRRVPRVTDLAVLLDVYERGMLQPTR